MRMFFIVIASIVSLIAAVVFVFMAKDFILIAVGVVLVIVAFYYLWRPPKKHKDYSLSDQQEATIRAGGGSGTSDLLDIKPSEPKSRRKK